MTQTGFARFTSPLNITKTGGFSSILLSLSAGGASSPPPKKKA